MGLLSLTQDPHRLETPSIHAEECGSQRELLVLPHQRRARGEKLVGESVLWGAPFCPSPQDIYLCGFPSPAFKEHPEIMVAGQHPWL